MLDRRHFCRAGVGFIAATALARAEGFNVAAFDRNIRLPIGLMFAILGVLLGGFGLFSDKSIYERSLGININLIWGTILIGFSVILLWMGSRKGRPR